MAALRTASAQSSPDAAGAGRIFAGRTGRPFALTPKFDCLLRYFYRDIGHFIVNERTRKSFKRHERQYWILGYRDTFRIRPDFPAECSIGEQFRPLLLRNMIGSVRKIGRFEPENAVKRVSGSPTHAPSARSAKRRWPVFFSGGAPRTRSQTSRWAVAGRSFQIFNPYQMFVS